MHFILIVLSFKASIGMYWRVLASREGLCSTEFR